MKYPFKIQNVLKSDNKGQPLPQAGKADMQNFLSFQSLFDKKLHSNPKNIKNHNQNFSNTIHFDKVRENKVDKQSSSGQHIKDNKGNSMS